MGITSQESFADFYDEESSHQFQNETNQIPPGGLPARRSSLATLLPETSFPRMPCSFSTNWSKSLSKSTPTPPFNPLLQSVNGFTEPALKLGAEPESKPGPRTS